MPKPSALLHRLYPVAPLKLRSRGIKVFARTSKFDSELLAFPAILDWLSASLANGANLYSALYELQSRLKPATAKQFVTVLRKVEIGASLEVALTELATEFKSPLVKEFVNRSVIAMQRGTPLALQLSNLAEASRSQLSNYLLERAGSNELKMLLPLVFLILPVTVWFAVFPSLQYLQFS